MELEIGDRRERDLERRKRPAPSLELVLDMFGDDIIGASKNEAIHSRTCTGRQFLVTNTDGWSEGQIIIGIELLKKHLDFDNAPENAKKWWCDFEKENAHRKPLVFRLAEELGARGTSISEFFTAYVHSDTDNIQANLDFLDRVKARNPTSVVTGQMCISLKEIGW